MPEELPELQVEEADQVDLLVAEVEEADLNPLEAVVAEAVRQSPIRVPEAVVAEAVQQQ